MAAVTLEKLRSLLSSRFGGLLKAGKHAENGEACALELLSAAKGLPWTDEPAALGSWDLRQLNDISVSDAIRAKHLLPVIAAYSEAASWPQEKQKAVADRLAILTANRLIAELPDLPERLREKYRSAETVEAAWLAATAARSAATWSAAWSAAWSARSAAWKRYADKLIALVSALSG